MTNDRFRSAAIGLRDGATRNRVSQWAVGRAPLPQPLKRLIPPIGKHVLHSPFGDPFTYLAHRDDVMARGIVWDDLASWERSTVVELCERFRSARRFWDIGAYAGIYSLLACAVNPEIEVVAVEPLPQHAGWLRENLAANGWKDRVHVIQAAIHGSGGPVQMTVVDDDPTASGIGVERPGAKIEVPSVRLDQLGSPPDVIKIDVEGHEGEALSTGVDILVEARPIVVIECLGPEALSSMLDYLGPLDYQLQHLGPGGLTLVDGSFTVPAGHANFLAMPNPLK